MGALTFDKNSLAFALSFFSWSFQSMGVSKEPLGPCSLTGYFFANRGQRSEAVLHTTLDRRYVLASVSVSMIVAHVVTFVQYTASISGRTSSISASVRWESVTPRRARILVA